MKVTRSTQDANWQAPSPKRPPITLISRLWLITSLSLTMSLILGETMSSVSALSIQRQPHLSLSALEEKVKASKTNATFDTTLPDLQPASTEQLSDSLIQPEPRSLETAPTVAIDQTLSSAALGEKTQQTAESVLQLSESQAQRLRSLRKRLKSDRTASLAPEDLATESQDSDTQASNIPGVKSLNTLTRETRALPSLSSPFDTGNAPVPPAKTTTIAQFPVPAAIQSRFQRPPAKQLEHLHSQLSKPQTPQLQTIDSIRSYPAYVRRARLLLGNLQNLSPQVRQQPGFYQGQPTRYVNPLQPPQSTAIRIQRSLSQPKGRPTRSFVFISSVFGQRPNPFGRGTEFHNGIDLVGAKGIPILATADGRVRRVSRGRGFGVHVVLEHSGGYETLYAHLSKKRVKSNQIVRKGQIIGFLGSTGRSTGPHLHYSVYRNNQAVDPRPYLFSE